MPTLQTEIAQGEISQRALDELKPRFDKIRENILNAWSSTTSKQIEEREILYHKLHVLNELERSFMNDITTGKLAEIQLETENASKQ